MTSFALSVRFLALPFPSSFSHHSRLRRFPPLLPSLQLSLFALPPPQRARELLPPPQFHAKNPLVCFSVPPRRSRRRTTGDEDESEMMGVEADLEAQIYEFMEETGNPNRFPTREELIAAGRSDLAEAIAASGGWLTLGWNSGDKNAAVGDSDALNSADMVSGNQAVPEAGGVSQERFSDGSCENVVFADSAPDSEVDPSLASSSERSIEIKSVETGGAIEGMLSRLEKERNLSLAISPKEIGQASSRIDKLVLGETDDTGNEMPDALASWRLQKMGFPGTKFDAADIVPADDKKILDHSILDEDLKDPNMHKQAQNSTKTCNRNESDFEKNQILLRLQHMESDLASVLRLLRSKINDDTAQGQKRSVDELQMLSDALEFQETDIVNAREKLRSIRARRAVLEGKIELEIIEAKKLMEDKWRRLDAAQNALRLLRTVCIVWPTSASEVLLVGSFDGWTNKRKMERSSSGIFSSYLKLYPGKYEIKFIVDGVWKIDPLRPVVHNNGNENNLLIVA